MESVSETDKMLRQYLLGGLASDEQLRLEEQLLIDDEYFEELHVVEDELIDEYVYGSLPTPERKRFEQFFLSTIERQQKVSFAKALKRYATAPVQVEQPVTVDQSPRPTFLKRIFPVSLRSQHPGLGYAIAAALIIIVSFSSWLLIKSLWQEGQVIGTGTTLSVALAPGTVRSAGEIKRVTVPANTSTLELYLQLATDAYQSYRAVVQTDEGIEVYEVSELKPEDSGAGKAVILRLSVRLVTSGDYRIKLNGLTDSGLVDAGSYSVRLTIAAS